jgi:hypothetical protein
MLLLLPLGFTYSSHYHVPKHAHLYSLRTGGEVSRSYETNVKLERKVKVKLFLCSTN